MGTDTDIQQVQRHDFAEWRPCNISTDTKTRKCRGTPYSTNIEQKNSDVQIDM
jgi:hypothetical protein